MSVINTFGQKISLDVGRPTVQVSFDSYIVEGETFDDSFDSSFVRGILSFTRGNGDFVVIFISPSPIGNVSIKDLTTIHQGATYKGLGLALYKGSDSSAEVVLPDGHYFIKGFEFNGQPSEERYMIKGSDGEIEVGTNKIFGIEFDETFE